MAGSHPVIQTSTPKLTSSALSMVKVARVEIKPELTVSLWEAENIGGIPSKRCGGCMQCSECTDTALIHSLKVQDEFSAEEGY